MLPGYFIFGFLLALLTLAALVSFSRVVILFDVAFAGHDLSTSRAAAKNAGEILKIYGKHTGVVYDLGSCRGDFLINLLGSCGLIKAFGVDSSKFRVRFSSVRSILMGRAAKFIQEDLFSANVSTADAVYLYLAPSAMPMLEKKLQKELKQGALVITNTQFFPNWQPDQIFITHPKNPEFEKMFTYIKT
jgi:hypothetical protein